MHGGADSWCPLIQLSNPTKFWPKHKGDCAGRPTPTKVKASTKIPYKFPTPAQRGVGGSALTRRRRWGCRRFRGWPPSRAPWAGGSWPSPPATPRSAASRAPPPPWPLTGTSPAAAHRWREGLGFRPDEEDWRKGTGAVISNEVCEKSGAVKAALRKQTFPVININRREAQRRGA